MKSRFYLIFVIFLILTACGRSRSLEWRYLNGTSVFNASFAMTVDSEGTVWLMQLGKVGDEINYIKKDGQIRTLNIAKVFKPIPDMPDKLCANNVVWITTAEGNLVSYDPRQDTWTPVVYLGKPYRRHDCVAYSDGKALVWHDNLIMVFSSQDDSYRVTYLDEGYSIVKARLDEQGRLWALTSGGVIFREEKGEWLVVEIVVIGDPARDFWVTNDLDWVVSEDKLFKIDGAVKKIVVDSPDKEILVGEIVQDNKGRFWLFQAKEIWRVEDNGTLLHFKYPTKKILETAIHEGVLYISTRDGIYSLELNSSK